MLEVYVPSSVDGYEFCYPIRQEDFETINVQIDGTPRCETWCPISMRLIHTDGGLELLPSDAPWLGSHALILRQSAIRKMGSYLREYGELLPLDCSEANLSIFNATHVLKALDEEASSVMRLSNGRIIRVNRHVFRSDCIAGHDFFKISNLRVSPIFFSKRAVQLWESTDLKGLAFTRVWSE